MRWIINNAIISLELENGKVIIPSARQIYLAEYKEKCSIEGTTVTRKPSQDLPHTSFSKYPLDLFLIINPPRAELSQPAMCHIAGIRNDIRINIDSISIKMPDHILQDNTWYPLIKESIDELTDILIANGISGPRELSLKQYLELRKRHSDWLIIEEQESSSEIKVEPMKIVPPRLFVGVDRQR